MTVAGAKKCIESMKCICDEAVAFDEKHRELEGELDFMVDAVAYLGDYMKLLERQIDEAELKI